MWEFDLQHLEELQPQINRLYDKKALIDKARPLPNIALQKIKDDLSLEWTYNSNSIEGNTITLRETQLILNEGITVSGKSLREHFEVYNHQKAIDYLYTLVDENYTLRGIDILNLHGLVLRSIEDEFAGRLRNGGVRIVGANFTPPNANESFSIF